MEPGRSPDGLWDPVRRPPRAAKTREPFKKARGIRGLRPCQGQWEAAQNRRSVAPLSLAVPGDSGREEVLAPRTREQDICALSPPVAEVGDPTHPGSQPEGCLRCGVVV